LEMTIPAEVLGAVVATLTAVTRGTIDGICMSSATKVVIVRAI
jgi:hypothetical protein